MDDPAKGSSEKSPPPQIEPLQVRRILAPTDLSELSGKSVLYAFRLGMALQAEIVVLHVHDVFVDPPGGKIDMGMVSSGEINSWRQQFKRDLDQHLAQLAPIPDNVVRVLRGSSDPWKEITNVAEEMKVDLLVVSTHGRSGLEHFLRGSDAEKILRQAPCPVVVIRSH